MRTLCVCNKSHLCFKHYNQSTTSSKDFWVLLTTTMMSNYFNKLLQMLLKHLRMAREASICYYSLSNPLQRCIWINALRLIFTKLYLVAKVTKLLAIEKWMRILRNNLQEFIAARIIKKMNEAKIGKSLKLSYMRQFNHMNIFKMKLTQKIKLFKMLKPRSWKYSKPIISPVKSKNPFWTWHQI